MISKSLDNPLWVIYGLRTVGDPEYRYVGYTTIGAARRLEKHKKDSVTRDFHVQRWIRGVGKADVIIDVLEECPEGDLLYIGEAEEFWICQIRSFGHRLTNLNGGGVGGNSGRSHTDETKAKISRSLLTNGKNKGESHSQYGRPLSAETKARMSLALTGNTHTVETKVLMSELAKARPDSHHKDRTAKANHTRWHAGRAIVKDGCTYCLP